MAVLPQMSLLNFPYTVDEVVMLGRIPHSSGHQTDREVVERGAATYRHTAPEAQALHATFRRRETAHATGQSIRAGLWREVPDRVDSYYWTNPPRPWTWPISNRCSWQYVSWPERGCSVVLVIHDLNLAASVADQILVLDKGQQAALGTPDQVFTQALFKEVFDVDVIISSHPQGDFPLITPCQQFL